MNSQPSRVQGHGRVWLCVSDSTGLFLGHLFRPVDIRADGVDDNWAEGMLFRHVEDESKTATVANGRMVLLPTPPVGDIKPKGPGGSWPKGEMTC